jgi:ATP-dependent DNA ligase
MQIERTFPSKSSPGKVYRTRFNTETHEGSCNCPGWTQRNVRDCTHLKRLREEFPKGRTAARPAPRPVAPPTPRPAPAAPQAVPADPAPAPAPAPRHRARPMLASAMPDGRTLTHYQSSEWALQEKFDGDRVLARKSGATLDAWSRPRAGRAPLTRALPDDIRAALLGLPDGLPDGELLLPGTTAKSTARRGFAIFDLLEVMGQSIAHRPYRERHQMLELYIAHHAGDLLWVPALEAVSQAAVQRIWDRGGEGAVLKRVTSIYREGYRSDEWVKVKKSATATVTIIGFERGKAASSTPTSVTKYRRDDGIEGTVSTRTCALERDIAAHPERYLGRRLVVSYQEEMESGRFRHAQWDHVLD